MFGPRLGSLSLYCTVSSPTLAPNMFQENHKWHSLTPFKFGLVSVTTKYKKRKRLGLKVVSKVFFKDGILVLLSTPITPETLGIKYHGKKTLWQIDFVVWNNYRVFHGVPWLLFSSCLWGGKEERKKTLKRLKCNLAPIADQCWVP